MGVKIDINDEKRWRYLEEIFCIEYMIQKWRMEFGEKDIT